MPSIAVLLTFIAGYADAVGFMALHGLFAAHVTGNFVTIGAAVVLGTSGVVTKLLALPTFSLFVALARLARYSLLARGLPVFRSLLAAEFVFLAGSCALVVGYGPFTNGDALPAAVAGLMLVAAMAIQNAFQRVHLAKEPPTTIMTGTTTQVMLDVADLMHGVPDEQKVAIRARLSRMGTAVVAFGLGCGLGAVCYAGVGVWCFAVPPLLTFATLFRHDAADGP
ncbi:MAG: DUF1275 domain-containing protein [Proteobacteria bacterium]|nr:DUF1275 domain-containing protein [Pseudomonadota bacterium]